ncbi:LytTR family DNA-binding domain-containing protein [Marinilactibacillus psychrotolerans]|uniref:LytTR family DNA-binding domain-containing protein n=1 Tax=Marinilactibacillus psychrotolerans TaxID=191770 RepID=UPI001865DA29|nr:LytTR family DNA-binding domain-containing protein [Marinilactibacillus psychrotolerans]GEQ32627.1 LytR family transcriptional regulator [Marinilactibacillus psychrotolerans]
MKLKLVEDKSLKEAWIDITYNIFDRRIQKIIDVVETSRVQLVGKIKDHGYVIDSFDVCYIESVDNCTFLYTESEVFENREKLYALENKLKNTTFVRISKSVLLNMDYLESVRPLTNYRLEANLENKEKLVINRHYVKEVKQYLNIG